MKHHDITRALYAERDAQRAKWSGPHEWGWGDCSSADVPMVVKAAVLSEETGEFVQAVLNAGPNGSVNDEAVRREAIQVLAVAWAILEGL